ncbi:MAG: PAS domain-containing protein [Nitrospiraceae bacterium]
MPGLSTNSHNIAATAGIAILVLAGFLWDLATPLGYVPWLLYVPAILLTLALPSRWTAPALAICCTALIVLGYWYPAPLDNRPSPAAAFNRSLGISILWLVTGVSLLFKRTELALRESENRLSSIVDNIPVTFFLKDLDGRYLRVNRAFETGLGMPARDILGKTDPDIFPPVQAAVFQNNDRQVLATGRPLEFEEVALSPDGPRTSIVHKFPLCDAGGTPYAIGGIATDITARNRIEQRHEGHRLVLEMLTTGQPLTLVLETLVRNIEAQAPGMLGSVLLLDHEGKRLAHGAAPSLPPEYCRAVDGIEIGPEVGSCGTAAYRGTTVIVENIATDPLWRNSRDLAKQYDLAACWSKPIRASNGRVLGTFAMYYHETHAPRPDELELLDSATQIAAIAVEGKQAEEALRASEERFRSTFAHAAVGVSLADPQGRILDVNQAFSVITGYSKQELLAMDFRSSPIRMICRRMSN